MKTFFIAACVVIACLQGVVAQSTKMEKQMDKAKEQLQKDKTDDAEKTLVDLLKDDPSYGEAWDLLAKIKYQEYKNSKANKLDFGGKITVTTKDPDGNDIPSENDSLGNALMQMLNKLSPSKIAFSEFMFTLRKATLVSENAYYCAIYMRLHTIDVEVDTNLTPKALKYYNQAEQEFEAKNYNKAALLYKRAIDEQPDFYKAHLYLGDSYFFQKNYVDAIASFKQAIERFPDFLEPRKYLIDAYHEEGLYGNALDAAIAAMTIYPDLSLKAKLEDAAYFNGQRLNIRFTPRQVFPLTIAGDTAKNNINAYSDHDTTAPAGPWVHYVNALDKLKGFCDEKGIITKVTAQTKARYLEVFGWEQMLSNSDDAALAEARRMQQAGYLDCYVFLTCFHHDFYDQYVHFVKNNKDRVQEYYKTFLVAR